jgi:site-specific recombinase XerD
MDPGTPTALSARSKPRSLSELAGSSPSTRAIDLLLRKLCEEAGVSISAHILRHSCLTNLIRQGNGVVLVAEIAGHRQLETTRRYSLSTDQDRATAMEALRVDD